MVLKVARMLRLAHWDAPVRKPLLILLLAGALGPWAQSEALAADANQVRQAIDRGAVFLKSRVLQSEPGYYSIAGYALLKADVSANAAQIPFIAANIQEKIQNGVYEPIQHHIYEAAVDLLVLEAADAQVYWDTIQTILNYLIAKQHARGSWFYPDRRDTGGDSSITQYAMLALWAADRAGFDVPASTWNQAAAWYLSTQTSAGAHVYHPGSTVNAWYAEPAHSMTAAGASSLLIAELNLYGDNYGDDESLKKRPPGKKFRVLERVDEAAKAPAGKVSATRRRDIKEGARRAIDWLADRYTLSPSRRTYYYFYGLERTAALANLKTLGTHDWFDEGSTAIVAAQHQDGSWRDRRNPESVVATTAFALLFLTKSTAKTLGRDIPDGLAGGLMAGGRGLPGQLSAVQMNDGKVETRKLAGEIDDLLLELENPRSLNVESAQAALVEALQYGDRKSFVGQTERLKPLVADPRPEVRRTAVWALGRTGDLSTAGLLVEALNDSEVDVLVEARNALCWISRRPRGMGLPANPLHDLPQDANAQQRQAAVDKWKAQALSRWRTWLFSARPYNQRNDLLETESRRR